MSCRVRRRSITGVGSLHGSNLVVAGGFTVPGSCTGSITANGALQCGSIAASPSVSGSTLINTNGYPVAVGVITAAGTLQILGGSAISSCTITLGDQTCGLYFGAGSVVTLTSGS